MSNIDIIPVIIPFCNGKALTQNCLNSVLAQDVPVEVLLMNCNSTDSTGQWARSVAADTPNVNYVYSPNKSVSNTWNRGLEWAFSIKPFAWVLNNDTICRAENARLLVEDGGPFVTAVGVSSLEQLREPLEPGNRRDRPDFSNFVIRKETWEALDGFDESYVGGFAEDCAAHVSLHRLGIRAYCIGLPFFHVGSGTIKNATPAEQDRIGKLAGLNRQRFFDTYGAHIGVPEEYDALFTPETFGINAAVPVSR